VIDFRYHLVSIIAIFLALAVGLVVGATTLTGPTETALRGAEQRISQRNTALERTNTALGNQLNAGQAFAQTNSGRIVAGLLTGQKVVLVVPPGTDSGMVSSVTSTLQQAGATVTGQLQLQQSFFDFSGPTETSLSSLARLAAAQAPLKLTASSNSTVSGQQEAAQVLAASILTTNKPGQGLPAAASSGILQQFANGNFVTVSPTTGSKLGTATLAVLFTPAGPSGNDAQATATSQALDAVATELHSYSLGTVMAGSVNAIPNSAITSIGSSGPVSTVDNADTASGQIMVAQALAQLAQGKPAGAYGVGPNSAPSPAPTPTGTPTPGISNPARKEKRK
jgi:copper transport outer membrane protein MctB